MELKSLKTNPWTEMPISSLCKILTKQTGFDYSAYIKPSLKQTNDEGTLPFIQNKDFNGKWINFETDYFIPENIAKVFPRILLDEKSLLISISGSIGNVGCYSSNRLAFIGGAIAIAKMYNPIHVDWITYYLQSNYGQQKLVGNVKAGSHHNLTLEDIRKFVLPIPNDDEIEAITNALSDMDNLIAGLEQLIEKKKAIKLGAMQELLRPKEGWVVKRLGEVFTFFSTSNFSKAEMYHEGEVGCIHYGLIHGIANTNYSLSNGVKYYVTNEQAKYEKIKDGDVIMVDASEDLIGLNKSIEISDVGNNQYIAGLHTFHLRDENEVFVNRFRGLILNSTYIKNQMLRLAVGMKVFGVSKPQLQQVLLTVPPIDVQLEIAAILSSMDNEIMLLEANLEKYKLLKQGMMQELLTGKTRLV